MISDALHLLDRAQESVWRCSDSVWSTSKDSYKLANQNLIRRQLRLEKYFDAKRKEYYVHTRKLSSSNELENDNSDVNVSNKECSNTTNKVEIKENENHRESSESIQCPSCKLNENNNIEIEDINTNLGKENICKEIDKLLGNPDGEKKNSRTDLLLKQIEQQSTSNQITNENLKHQKIIKHPECKNLLKPTEVNCSRYISLKNYTGKKHYNSKKFPNKNKSNKYHQNDVENKDYLTQVSPYINNNTNKIEHRNNNVITDNKRHDNSAEESSLLSKFKSKKAKFALKRQQNNCDVDTSKSKSKVKANRNIDSAYNNETQKNDYSIDINKNNIKNPLTHNWILNNSSNSKLYINKNDSGCNDNNETMETQGEEKECWETPEVEQLFNEYIKWDPKDDIRQSPFINQDLSPEIFDETYEDWITSNAECWLKQTQWKAILWESYPGMRYLIEDINDFDWRTDFASATVNNEDNQLDDDTEEMYEEKIMYNSLKRKLTSSSVKSIWDTKPPVQTWKIQLEDAYIFNEFFEENNIFRPACFSYTRFKARFMEYDIEKKHNEEHASSLDYCFLCLHSKDHPFLMHECKCESNNSVDNNLVSKSHNYNMDNTFSQSTYNSSPRKVKINNDRKYGRNSRNVNIRSDYAILTKLDQKAEKLMKVLSKFKTKIPESSEKTCKQDIARLKKASVNVNSIKQVQILKNKKNISEKETVDSKSSIKVSSSLPIFCDNNKMKSCCNSTTYGTNKQHISSNYCCKNSRCDGASKKPLNVNNVAYFTNPKPTEDLSFFKQWMECGTIYRRDDFGKVNNFLEHLKFSSYGLNNTMKYNPETNCSFDPNLAAYLTLMNNGQYYYKHPQHVAFQTTTNTNQCNVNNVSSIVLPIINNTLRNAYHTVIPGCVGQAPSSIPNAPISTVPFPVITPVMFNHQEIRQQHLITEVDMLETGAVTKKRLYSDVLAATGSGNTTTKCSETLEEKYDQLEREAEEQYRTGGSASGAQSTTIIGRSEDSVTQAKFQELEQLAIEQYTKSCSSFTSTVNPAHLSGEKQNINYADIKDCNLNIAQIVSDSLAHLPKSHDTAETNQTSIERKLTLISEESLKSKESLHSHYADYSSDDSQPIEHQGPEICVTFQASKKSKLSALGLMNISSNYPRTSEDIGMYNSPQDDSATKFLVNLNDIEETERNPKHNETLNNANLKEEIQLKLKSRKSRKKNGKQNKDNNSVNIQKIQ